MNFLALKTRIVMFFAAASLLLVGTAARPPATPAVSSAQQATEFCLQYAYPLPIFADSIGGTTNIAFRVNKLGLAPRGNDNGAIARRSTSPTLSVRAVVRPNTDTAYDGLVFDLAQEDVAVTVPPMEPDRVYIYAFYDIYGDNFVNIGSISGSSPGNYLLQPALLTGNYGFSTDNCSTDYVGCIRSPTLHGHLTIRAEKKNRTSVDQQYINQYFSQVKAVGMNQHNATAKPLNDTDFANLSPNKTIQALQLLARLGSRNPPQSIALGRQIHSMQIKAGVNPTQGVYKSPSGVNLARAQADLARNITKFTLDPTQNPSLNNGWFVVSPSLSGNFDNGTNLIARAYVAKVLFLELTADQSIYVGPGQNVGQQFTLADNQSYLLTFSGKPPIGNPGFWSLTMYNGAGFLVANAQGILSLGDRSNLTYSDGEPVYGPDGRNDTFQILIQSTAVTPPDNWTNNWLPSPAGGKAFSLVMRLYASQDAGKNGSYLYPTLVKQTALLNQTSDAPPGS